MIVSPSQEFGYSDRGWLRNRAFDAEGHRLVRLRRVRRVTVEEGVFTCDIPGDDNTPGSVGVYYPSESVSVCIIQ